MYTLVLMLLLFYIEKQFSSFFEFSPNVLEEQKLKKIKKKNTTATSTTTTITTRTTTMPCTY